MVTSFIDFPKEYIVFVERIQKVKNGATLAQKFSVPSCALDSAWHKFG